MRKTVTLFLTLLLLVFWGTKKNPLFADELTDLEKKIAEYQKQIDFLQGQERTLSQQISLMDNQIKITTLKISETQAKIKTLQVEIESLSGKIGRLEESLKYLSKVLLKRIAETYKSAKIEPFVLFLSSRSFSEFISRLRYLQVVQSHDRQLLFSMEQTRTNYDEQKKLKEKIQDEMEKLNQQLLQQKKNLAVQIEDRKRLLSETKGKEAEYQKLLTAALSEQETILKSMQESILKLADGSKVEKGKEVALIGNSGYPCCSTGAHLHFMITTGCQRDEKGYVKSCSPVNPADYLKKTSVSYEAQTNQMDFKGDWDWPIDGPRITQEYGMSYWARTGYYGGKPHNGIDIVNNNGVIKAPREGVLYRNSTTCGGCSGKCCATVNFVALDHGGGVYSWYWHVK